MMLNLHFTCTVLYIIILYCMLHLSYNITILIIIYKKNKLILFIYKNSKVLTPILSDEPESFTYFNLILFMNKIKYSLLIIQLT